MTHTKDKKEEWEKKLAEIGFIHPPLIVFIKNLLKQNRQQLIDEVVTKVADFPKTSLSRYTQKY